MAFNSANDVYFRRKNYAYTQQKLWQVYRTCQYVKGVNLLKLTNNHDSEMEAFLNYFSVYLVRQSGEANTFFLFLQPQNNPEYMPRYKNSLQQQCTENAFMPFYKWLCRTTWNWKRYRFHTTDQLGNCVQNAVLQGNIKILYFAMCRIITEYLVLFWRRNADEREWQVPHRRFAV